MNGCAMFSATQTGRIKVQLKKNSITCAKLNMVVMWSAQKHANYKIKMLSIFMFYLGILNSRLSDD